MGMPVTTPAAKLMAKIFVQKAAMRADSASRRRAAFQVYAATKGARPIVPIGNR